jgi:hypothetical protein
MTSHQFLIMMRDDYKCCPNCDDQGRRPVSNSQLFRWLSSGAVTFNGERLSPKQEVTFPLTEVAYFPRNPRKRITF